MNQKKRYLLPILLAAVLLSGCIRKEQPKPSDGERPAKETVAVGESTSVETTDPADGTPQTTPPDTVPNEDKDTPIIHPTDPAHPVEEPSEKPTVPPVQPTDPPVPPTQPSAPGETADPDAGVELPPLPIE